MPGNVVLQDEGIVPAAASVHGELRPNEHSLTYTPSLEPCLLECRTVRNAGNAEICNRKRWCELLVRTASIFFGNVALHPMLLNYDPLKKLLDLPTA